jgi:hypothetical protein
MSENTFAKNTPTRTRLMTVLHLANALVPSFFHFSIRRPNATTALQPHRNAPPYTLAMETASHVPTHDEHVNLFSPSAEAS